MKSEVTYKNLFHIYSTGSWLLILEEGAICFLFCFFSEIDFVLLLSIQSALFGQPSLRGMTSGSLNVVGWRTVKGAGVSQADSSPPLSINPSLRRERSVRLMERAQDGGGEAEVSPRRCASSERKGTHFEVYTLRGASWEFS